MPLSPEEVIQRVAGALASSPGVRSIALVGSRGSGDPSRIDRYSDVDLLICCDRGDWARLLAGGWTDAVGRPGLVFPRIMDDEARFLFPGLLACELHLLTPEQVATLSGACELGSFLATGCRVLHDPGGDFARLIARLRPERTEELDPAAISSVFWYNVAYGANLIARGDLFRASRYTNWFLQLFLLHLFQPIDGPDDTKYVERKIGAARYAALAGTVSLLERKSMAEGLCRCMECYWRFIAEVAPDLDPALLDSYRTIERDVVRLLAVDG